MNTPKNFIGIDALQQVANQVFKSVVMGPQYAAPEEILQNPATEFAKQLVSSCR